uniref:Small ribosomal subunit protein uS4c n=1 Tax=Prototheca wickerhamii TaxID=3111 RepID=RR4_PROWI|nr:RecName: Full=Small ribosomal subunit protein uS4c; AltName: Full=Plastid 30S ribosomal protein S4 [Prototheca wickerhamii]CAB53104.1 30S ribosomal protein S4 [Prototheca wickerhamii]
MSRYRGPRLPIIRRLGELPGFSKKIDRNHTPPGQHGWKKKASDQKKSKESQYGIRLKEKQKLRYNYGINERQLINYVREARRRKGSTGEVLLQLLEMRLDNIIYRLGFAPTIPAARQLINHGHINVNNKNINIPSYICKINDIISVLKNSQQLIKNYLQNGGISELSTCLNLNKEKLEASINNIIPRDLVKLEINELLVIEYYSRKL